MRKLNLVDAFVLGLEDIPRWFYKAAAEGKGKYVSQRKLYVETIGHLITCQMGDIIMIDKHGNLMVSKCVIMRSNIRYLKVV